MKRLIQRISDLRTLPDGLSVGWWVAGSLFLLSFFSQSFDADLAFWKSWMEMIQSGGYSALKANYPPVLLHWIAIGGALFQALGFHDVSLLLIKVWVEIPVWATWMVLLYQVAHLLQERGITPSNSGVFWLTVLNPAILLDGPIWGQVDLLPWIPLSLGLFAHIKGRHAWGPIWFALALAIKFQSIVFAPLFAALFLRGLWLDRRTLWGIAGFALVLSLTFLPFIWVGRGWEQAGDAYWNNVGFYPYATYNAANLWYLLTPSGALRNAPIPGLEAWGWMTPNRLGLVLFGAFSMFVFVAALRQKANVWALGVLAMFAFFAFSSEMHERYLFTAVPLAAIWAATETRGRLWYAIATFSVSLNIAFLLFSKSAYEWSLLSFLVVASVPVLLTHALGWKFPSHLWTWGDRRPMLSMLLAFAIPVSFFFVAVLQRHSDLRYEGTIGEERAFAHWIPERAVQDWSDPKFKTRFWYPGIGYAQRNIQHGIKVHARSELQYALPVGRFEIMGWCGPDREAGNQAEMRFEIATNRMPVWSSDVMRQNAEPKAVDVVVQGPASLQLRVDPVGAIHGDHALWGDLVIRRID